MALGYEKWLRPKYRIEVIHGHESIVISPRRRVFLSLFCCCWLVGWTIAGISSVASLTAEFSAFTPFSIGGWALGWIVAALQLVWLLRGSETFDVANGDLIISYRGIGLPIRKVFRGRDIRRLMPNPHPFAFRGFGMSAPFYPLNQSGSIQFNYGLRTVYAGCDLDQEDSRRVVRRLAGHLPPSATGAAW